MFDIARLQEILVQYKKDFADYVWNNERYKWIAVQNFQDNWDVNAEDFAEMLEKSLSKTANLLTSMNTFPKRIVRSQPGKMGRNAIGRFYFRERRPGRKSRENLFGNCDRNYMMH